MKYHNNLKTILITAFVVLLFLSVSVFLLVSLHLTSPTMIITDSLMKAFSEADSDISIEVDNLERNFRDRVMLNNLRIFYRSEEFASFRTVEVKLGLFDVISYFLNLEGSAEVSFTDGRISIPSSILEVKEGKTEESSGKVEESEAPFSSFLSSHNITLSFSDTYIETPYSDAFIDEVYLSYIGKSSTVLGEIASDEINLSYEGNAITLSSPRISFSASDTLYLSFSLSSLSLSSEKFNAETGEISFSASSASLSDVLDGKLKARLDVSSLSSRMADLEASISKVNLLYTEDKILTGRIEKADMSSSSFSVTLDDLSAEMNDFRDYSLIADEIEGSVLSVPVRGEKLSLRGETEERILSFNMEKITSEASLYTKDILEGITVSGMKGGIDYSDGVKLTLSLDASAETESTRIDDISFSLDSSLSLRDGKITSSDVSLNNIYLGYGKLYDSRLTIYGNLDEAHIALDYGAFDIDLTASLSSRTLTGSVAVSSLPLKNLVPLFTEREVKLFNSSSSLSLSSAFSLYGKENGKISGSLSYSLSVDPLSLSFFESSLLSSAEIVISDDRIVFDDLRLSTSFVSLEAEGYYDLKRHLPDLNFIASLGNGKEVMNGYIHLGDEKAYRFYADFSALEETYLSGSVDFSREGSVKSSALLLTRGKERPFSLSVDTEEKKIDIHSPSLAFFFDYSDGIRGRATARNLETLRSDDGRAISFDGEVNVSYSLSDGLSLSSSTISVKDIFLIPSSPSLSFTLSGTGERIRLDSISVLFRDESLYTGAFSCDFDSNTLAFALREEEGKGSVLFSLYKEDEFTAVFKADGISLSSLGLDKMVASANLYGRAKRIEDFSFTGAVDIVSSENDSRKISGDITIDGTSLLIRDALFTYGDTEASVSSVYIKAGEGSFGFDGFSFYLENMKADGACPVKGVVSLSGTMPAADSLYSSLVSLLQNRLSGVSLTLNIENLDLDSSLFVLEDRYAEIKVDDEKIVLGGNFLEGTYSKERKDGSLTVFLENLAQATFTFDLSSSLKVTADIDGFNMALVNLLLEYPTLVFRNDLVQGEVSLTGEGGEYSLNGALHTDELGVDVFWVEDQTLIFHNASFVLWDNELSSSMTYVTVFDKKTSSRKSVKMTVGVAMSPTLSMESWDVDVYIDDENSVRVRIPLPLIGIDILGYVTGHYHAYADSAGMDNDGVLHLTDTAVSIGMNPYPKWYDEIGGATFMNMTLDFGKNNSVLYPAGEDPIFSIDLQENSSVYMYMGEDGSYSFSGNVLVRGGEIYYFQKYFYITSGSISFDDPKHFNPKINLRASLRDYSSSNEKVEIYLVLKDNTFDNLSPTLESSPVMELSEIMEILGQSILPQSTYGSVSVSSVASLVTEGYDILSRLGIVTTGNPLSSLSSSLKRVFGVDSFSLHSNILNNIVTDTISQATNSTTASYSPMARFLNGTTMNVGKYLSQNLYLQVMVHLEATGDRKSYTIISDDLALDTELSLEWANPAFNVTFFTRPSYFSFDSILSTFGFSLTKTVNF